MGPALNGQCPRDFGDGPTSPLASIEGHPVGGMAKRLTQSGAFQPWIPAQRHSGPLGDGSERPMG